MRLPNLRLGTLFGVVVLMTLGLLIAACGSPDPTPTPGAPTPTPPTGETPTPTPDPGFDAEEYFRGQTITIVVGFTAGGGYDAYARLVQPYLEQHIPGNPTVVVENMPGGGGLTAANYIYNAGRQDGTHIGLTISSYYFSEFNEESGVDFVTLEMTPLGSPVSDNVLVYIREDYVGDRDLFQWADDIASGDLRPPFWAGTGFSATILPEILAELVPGLEYEYVLGYPGQTEVRLAIRQGEADGSSGSESSLLEQLSDMIDSGELRILAQTGTGALERDPDYPDAPTMTELAQGDGFQEALVSAFVARSVVGRPFFLPPNVPDEVANVLKEALWEVFNDPDFLADAEQQNRPVSPVTAEAHAQMYNEVFSVSEEDRQRIREIAGAED